MRALLQRPELLVLDESFSALDPENVERAMRRYAQARNGEAWQPAARVTELAASNGRFNA